MATGMDMDLWPKAKFETDLVTPASILRRQAALLGEKTQQLVTAEVHTESLVITVTHRFRLVVPSLGNYKYELFRVEHRVEDLYPITAIFQGAQQLRDQQQFVDWLKQTLSSEVTARKIDSLLAQAKG